MIKFRGISPVQKYDSINNLILLNSIDSVDYKIKDKFSAIDKELALDFNNMSFQEILQ